MSGGDAAKAGGYQIVFRNAAELIPYQRNTRTHSDEQIAKVMASLVEFGWTNPVLLDGDNGIVAGHARTVAALRLYDQGKSIKLPSGEHLDIGVVPTIDCSGWSEAQKKAYIIADNAIAAEAGWDANLLKLELDDLTSLNFNLDLLGFSADNLAAALGSGSAGDDGVKELLTDPDAVPETPQDPVTVRGDVWVLGPHRLVCGDCTDADTVSKCLGLVEPMLMVTDPPYGVEYDADWRTSAKNGDGSLLSTGTGRANGEVLNDDRADWSVAYALFPGDVAYVWTADRTAHLVAHSLVDAGYQVRSQIIWRKNQFVVSRGHYHPQHEPCQPAGTIVAKVLKDGRWREDSLIEQVPIETLKLGDKVVSFGGGKIYRRGRPITEISSRRYTGNMHTVTVGRSSTRATAEHMFSVRFDPSKPKAGLLYVMQRGDRWRIGVCGMFNSRGFGLAVRLSQERGERAWIIGAFADLRAARVAEQVTCCQYGIPTTCWETDRQTGQRWVQRDQDGIATIYRQLGVDRIADGVTRLMADYGLKAEYPLITAEDVGRFSRKQSRVVRTCNLVPEIMQLPVPTTREAVEWRSISSATFSVVRDEQVWSMNVEGDHHYVADGLVTHNCIYAVKRGGTGHWAGDRKQSTVWDIDKPHKSDTGHSTQKPVECMRRPMENNSSSGQAVYDPFLGSGTTIIAAEQIGRACYGIELLPAHCDVSILRWQEATGEVARLEATGQTFVEMMAERVPEKVIVLADKKGKKKAS